MKYIIGWKPYTLVGSPVYIGWKLGHPIHGLETLYMKYIG